MLPRRRFPQVRQAAPRPYGENYADLDLEKATIEHEFSSPWDDSDLILVVEDQKLHVHSTILKMTSPVFKAMLSSNFKEKDANEITLPWKKVDEFVDFLRQIYPQFNSVITLNSIKYIYRLADEYQVTRVMEDCRVFLFSVGKTKWNAMDMLLLAQDMEAEEARQQCCHVLRNMTLNELTSLKGYPELNARSLNDILLPLVRRYDTCMKLVLPELIGSLDAMMQLWCHPENKYKMRGVPSPCSKCHYSISERVNCDICKGMFSQMTLNAQGYCNSPSKTYLSENIVRVLQEMVDLTK